jgi:sulfide dehydrogenase cytochrome subunit
MKLTHIAAGLAALTVSGTAAASTSAISRGEVIAATCYTCHGTHGVSPSSIPSIDHIPATRMIEMLKHFKAGTRSSTVMGRHASAYTDGEIAEVANYLASLQKREK